MFHFIMLDIVFVVFILSFCKGRGLTLFERRKEEKRG